MRRWVVPACIVGLAVLAGALAPAGMSVAARPVRASEYLVRYRIVEPGTGRAALEETVEVHRPYDGRIETTRAGRVIAGRITNREYLWQLTEDGELAFGVRRPPGGPARDVSFDALLDAAADGIVAAGGMGSALGLRCRWFSYGDAHPMALTPPKKSSRIESCVDPRGIVLRESWSYSGRNARIVEATEIRTSRAAPARFLVGKNPESERVKARGADAVLRSGFIVVDNAKIAGVPFAVRGPSGWSLGRRAVYAIGGSGIGGQPTQLLSEAFVKEDGLVVVERGTNSRLSPPWGPDEGKEIALGRGTARIVYFLDRVELRLVSSLGFARVIAPSRELAVRFAGGISAA